MKPITESRYHGLKGYLERLFDKYLLGAAGLMQPYESLDFHVNCIVEGKWYSASVVSMSSPTISDIILPDCLFKIVVDRFRSVTHDVYVIGEPGSGALKFCSKAI